MKFKNEFAIKKALEHLNIDEHKFIDVYEKYNYKPFSVEEFLYTDITFVSEFMPEKLIEYIKQNSLSIETYNLEQCVYAKKRLYEIDYEISLLDYSYSYGYDDEAPDFTDLYEEQDALIDLLNKTNIEVFKIKELILNKLK